MRSHDAFDLPDSPRMCYDCCRGYRCPMQLVYRIAGFDAVCSRFQWAETACKAESRPGWSWRCRWKTVLVPRSEVTSEDRSLLAGAGAARSVAKPKPIQVIEPEPELPEATEPDTARWEDFNEIDNILPTVFVKTVVWDTSANTQRRLDFLENFVYNVVTTDGSGHWLVACWIP